MLRLGGQGSPGAQRQQGRHGGMAEEEEEPGGRREGGREGVRAQRELRGRSRRDGANSPG